MPHHPTEASAPARPARVFIETYGCAFNAADGEALAGVLATDGFALAASADAADVVVLNTCTVKDRTYRNFEKRLGALRSAAERGEGPRVVLAGCIPQAQRRGGTPGDLPALGPETIDRAGEVVRAALEGRPLQRLGREDSGAPDRLALPARRRNPAVEILPIASGCLSACTFCQTRLARGRLVSFRPGDILERARRALDDGVTELWVTAQDTGAWGHDAGERIPALLDRLCALPGDFRVRLGMTSPMWVLEDLDAWLGALAHPKMFRFLHVPLQSGSDAVLAAMKRGNTAADFIRIADAFYAAFPEGMLMTDIIAGYPTESDADFEATLSVLARARPVAVNRSRFSPRPGTAAARLLPLPAAVMARRSRRLADVARELARTSHRRLVGRSGRVLTCEETARGETLAHDASYRPVVLGGRRGRGRWFDVRYVEARDYHLLAEPAGEG